MHYSSAHGISGLRPEEILGRCAHREVTGADVGVLAGVESQGQAFWVLGEGAGSLEVPVVVVREDEPGAGEDMVL